MSIGLIIAKPGIDAASAKIQDTYVNTAAPILKVHDRGHGSITFQASETNITRDIEIPYDLGYLPLMQAFAERKPDGNMCLAQSTNQQASTDVLSVISAVRPGRILIRFITDADNPAGTYRYLYYIFSDEVAEND